MVGPLLGYVVVSIGFAIFIVWEWGYNNSSGLQLPDYLYGHLSMIGYAYFFGGLQATLTGIYASVWLSKYGKSSSIGAIAVASASTLIVAVFTSVLIGGFDLSLTPRLLLILLPPALISTIVIHSLERYFRMPAVQAKS